MMQEAPLGADFTSLAPHADVPATRPTAGFKFKFLPAFGPDEAAHPL